MISAAFTELAAGGQLRADVEISQLARIFVGAMVSFSVERSACAGVIENLDHKIDAAWKALETLFLKRGKKS